jgi:hypothetical protein
MTLELTFLTSLGLAIVVFFYLLMRQSGARKLQGICTEVRYTPWVKNAHFYPSITVYDGKQSITQIEARHLARARWFVHKGDYYEILEIKTQTGVKYVTARGYYRFAFYVALIPWLIYTIYML